MKKLFFLVSFLAFIGVSSAWAQVDEVTHQLGEKHTFTVTDNINSTFVWSVYDVAPEVGTGFTTKTPITSGFTPENVNTNAASFTWTIADEYWVAVTETSKEANGCSTTRYIKVTVEANTYELAVINNKITGEDGDISPSACLAGAGRTFINTADINKLSNTIWYKVSLKNGTTPTLYTRDSWKVSLKLTLTNSATPTATPVTPTNVTVSCLKSNKSAYSGMTLALNGTDPTELTVNKGDGEFYIKLVFDDEFNAAANSNLKIKLDATNLKVGNGNIGEATANAEANNFEYIRSTYPNTGKITVD